MTVVATTLPKNTRAISAVASISVRQVRLVSGMVLFAYILSHFTNHALGNISNEALDAGVQYHVMLWGNPVGQVVLYAALTVHLLLGVWALYARREFRWRASELTQLLLGLAIPLLILMHVIGVRLSANLYGANKGYPQVLFADWIATPYMAYVMYAALLTCWVHGCLGIYFWLRLHRWFRQIAPLLLAIAVLLPALALLGVYQGSQRVKDMDSVEWREENYGRAQLGTPEQQRSIADITNWVLYGYVGLVGLALLARGARALVERRRGLIRLTYDDGKTYRVRRGLTVLEVSTQHGIPHSSVCGGRARCSTCRVRVLGDIDALPPPTRREAFVLDRVGVADDPAIRLACQLRPQTDISIVPLFPANLQQSLMHTARPSRIGQERYLVGMFVDMRGSTQLAETRLPFDTVFIVNRFLAAVSQAVVAAGGEPNQFVGDGELALFGLKTDPRTACRQAIRAAALVAANVEELNRFLVQDLPEPIRFGIGIHGGEVIIGDIGYRDHMVFTALGDAINVSARLQDMTKAMGCQVVLSEEVMRVGEIRDDTLPLLEVDIRGRAESMMVRKAENAASLLALVERTASPGSRLPELSASHPRE